MERSPLWGHNRCAYHRSCSGKDKYEPYNCTECTTQKENVPNLSENDRPAFFQAMYDLLESTKQFHHQVLGIDWEYWDILTTFFDNCELPAVVHDEHMDRDEQEVTNSRANDEDDNQNENTDRYEVFDEQQGHSNNRSNQYFDGYNAPSNSHMHYDMTNDNQGTMYQHNYNQNLFSSFHNQPPPHAIPHYDIYGRPSPYHMQNNGFFNQGVPTYTMPRMPTPLYHSQPQNVPYPPTGGQQQQSWTDCNTGETWAIFYILEKMTIRLK